jgi:methylenetetrahydrofolate dehydrogenase (NADP+)/methenyltetrahydrofolate cyclohydrolase
MTATRLDGGARAARILEEVRAELAAPPLRGLRLRLASVSVGSHPAGSLYVRNQSRACADLGIEFHPIGLPADADEEALVRRIQDLNADPDVTGILLQRPFPPGFNARRLQAKVHPDKDLEGMNPANLGLIVYGTPRLAPCTALAAVDLARASGVPFKGREAAVIGHSEIVGKPIAFLLLNEFATATIAHIETRDLALHTRKADFLFVAVGRPGLVTGEMVKRGAVVIDIGISRVAGPGGEARTVGDVEEASVREVAGFLSPVPGGVGPMTVAMLMRNTAAAAREQASKLAAR